MIARAGGGRGGGRLGVLGTLVMDTIRRPGETEAVEAPGGIAYSLAAFEVARPDGWEAVPLVKVGEDAAAAADRLLARLSAVASREGVREVPAPNNRVELLYDGSGERVERLSGGVPAWSWDELEPLVGSCDAVYVNLIAGWELSLACARRLGEAFEGPLYCDLHSLFLDHGDDGARRPRVPENWREWFACFDYVQLNRGELGLLARDAGVGPWSLADELVADGPRAVFVTLGAHGAAWRERPAARAGRAGRGPGDAEGAPRRGRLAPPRRVEEGDPTGCGDVWGVVCFVELLAGSGCRAAVARANALACRNAAASGGLGLLEAAPSRRDASRGAGPRGRRGAGREEERP